VQALEERLAAFRKVFELGVEGWADEGEAELETGVDYRPGEPVRVRIRKRGRRWDVDDAGRAVELAGRPDGWQAAAERTVGEEGMNVNRAGIVFVPIVERPGRDLARIALRLGDASHAVYVELLELE
jgi:hypothetical protein